MNYSKLNLRSVLVLVISLTGISVIYQRPLVQLVLLALTLLLLLFIKPSRKTRIQLFKRISRIGKIILVIFFFQLLFRRNGEIIWQFSFLRITDIGFNYALASSLRFFLIILVAGLLMDFPFQDYLIALNAWKFPYEIAFIVAATIHFLPVFKSTFDNKMEALALRGISIKKLTMSQRLKAFRLLLLPVLATAIHDIHYRAISLELRAFRLHNTRTYLHKQKLMPADQAVIFLSLFLSALTFFLLSC